MNPADIPPTVLVRNALEAFSKAKIKATVLFSVEKNGKIITRADTNVGPQGMAQHLAAARIQDGAIERAAVALHEARVQLPPDASDVDKVTFDVCAVCGQAENWSTLDDAGREFHRSIVKLVVGCALAAPPATSPLVSV